MNKLKFNGIEHLLEKAFTVDDYLPVNSETAAQKKEREDKLLKEKKSDALAQDIISRRVTEDIENSLIDFNTAKEMIDFLDEKYKRKDVQSLGLIKRELLNLKKKEFSS